MMNRKVFYSNLRPRLGALTQANVDGFEAALNFALSQRTPLHFLAYILATFWWETGKTMQPVKEAYWLSEAWRKKNLRYFPFYGRGHVQFTWEVNYRKATEVWNRLYRGSGPVVDFVKNPDLLLQTKYSIPLSFHGMLEGWFTGKSLSDYIDNIDEYDKEDLREFTNARRVVNGVDKQVEIGKLALAFEAALKAAGYDPTGSVPLVPEPGPTVPDLVVPPPVVVEVEDKITISVNKATWELFLKWAEEEGYNVRTKTA